MTAEKTSITRKIREECAQNTGFKRAHRMVQLFMAFWAAIILIDRLIGISTNAYDGTQKIYALAGAAVLIAVAWAGTRGHLTFSMLLMQINMAVFCIQFVSTCFYYSESVPRSMAFFYGISAVLLVAFSLMLFLNRDLEAYRERLHELKHGSAPAREPLFVRTNTRLLRNKKR